MGGRGLLTPLFHLLDKSGLNLCVQHLIGEEAGEAGNLSSRSGARYDDGSIIADEDGSSILAAPTMTRRCRMPT